MATPDNGLAALLYSQGKVTAKVGDGTEVSVTSSTHYPFEDKAILEIAASKPVAFPLYLRIPEWAKGATVSVGGKSVKAEPGKYLRLEKTWQPGEEVEVKLPMKPKLRVWDQMKDSVSVDYGPLTFSLKIGEEFKRVDSRATAIGDSGWQPQADPSKWPSFEIHPTTPWNYGLVQKPTFRVVKKAWPTDDYPFTQAAVPLEIVTQAKRIPTWGIDENGLVAILPKSPVSVSTATEQVTLVPMGAARLRISSFPTVK